MTMRETALGLAARGFKVFPIKAGQKTPPLIAQWQVHATSDAAQVTAWWTQWPDANVGIHCDGLVVIDVDPKKGGFDSLTLFEQEIELEETYEVETPSGGRHLYYRASAPVRNGVDVLGRGLDIRSTSGYVVAAGSSTAAGAYRVFCGAAIADIDPAIVERCHLPGDGAGVRAERDDVPVDTDADGAVARAISHLRSHPVAVQGQGGDHHTFRTVCRVRDFGVPQERAVEALAEWNSRCVPPWDAPDLSVKITNAYAYAQDAAGKLTPEALGFEPIVEAPETTAPQQRVEVSSPAPAAGEMLHPSDVVLSDVLLVDYLVKGVLERQSNAVLFGKWNVGKTFVVLDVAAAIATGQEWFKRRTTKGRVLYLGYEGIRAMKKRIIALREKHPLLKDPATPFAWAPLRHPMTQAEGKMEVQALIHEFAKRYRGAPDLVIIDPLANALGGDDSDANLMAVLNTAVAGLMRAYKCTVLRVHHAGHGNEDRARGHSSLPAGIDTEIRVDDQEIALTKQRDDVRGRFGFKLKVVKIGRDADGDEVSTCVIEQIEDNPMSPELTGPQRELLDALLRKCGNEGHASQADIRDALPGMTPAKRREIVAALELKQYLRKDGTHYVIVERGPMAIFD